MLSEVALLMVLLASPDFSMRENVSHVLKDVPEHVLYLLTFSPDPECRWRATVALNGRQAQARWEYIQSQRPIPWIDALPPDYPDRCNIISEFLATTREQFPKVDVSDSGQTWPSYRIAMELYLQTLPLMEVKRILTVTPKNSYWGACGWITPPVFSVKEE